MLVIRSLALTDILAYGKLIIRVGNIYFCINLNYLLVF